MKGRETGVSVCGNLGGKKHRKLLDLLSDIQLPDRNVLFLRPKPRSQVRMTPALSVNN